MRIQRILRIALGVSAAACLATFVHTREAVDLVAALLFVLVTHSTGAPRKGAFTGAVAACAAVAVIRIHQAATGVAPTGPWVWISLLLAAVAGGLGVLALLRWSRGEQAEHRP